MRTEESSRCSRRHLLRITFTDAVICESYRNPRRQVKVLSPSPQIRNIKRILWHSPTANVVNATSLPYKACSSSPACQRSSTSSSISSSSTGKIWEDTVKSFIELFTAARSVSTPEIAVRTFDPASTIQNVVRSLGETAELTPLMSWDCVHGLRGLNP